MNIQKLSSLEGYTYVVDLVDWPNGIGLLLYLEEVAEIKVYSKFSWPLSGEFEAEFEYKECQFRLSTLISSPCLLANRECDEDIFTELVNYLRNYPGTGIFKIGYGFIKYLFLPCEFKS